MLHCVNAQTGLLEWQVPGIDQFAAVTKDYVYGMDRYGSIHILNVADGTPVGRIYNEGSLKALVNDQTDRLYLISEAGLVQCLHEIDADEPKSYVAPPKTEGQPGEAGKTPAEELPAEGAATEDAAAEAPANENPFGAGAEQVEPAAEEASPFGTGEEDPFNN
jgi:hypothetical protein